LAEGSPKPPKRRGPVAAVGADGLPVGNKINVKGCELSGARCPQRMKVFFDENIGCACKE
jgi:hypothetical protein